jgi:predicted metal-dependent hydrolase
MRSGNSSMIANMQKEIILEDKKVPYTLRRSPRARRMRLAVHYDGTVVLTVPLGLSETAAEKFVNEKVRWVLSKIDLFSRFRGSDAIVHRGREDYIKHKDAALVVARESVLRLNKIYGYRYNRISVRNQRTCWGSCSRKGNLNFNYRILFLPDEVRDYVIVHELCHLGEFNHSKRFWELVAIASPDFLAIRKELKKSGLNFH